MPAFGKWNARGYVGGGPEGSSHIYLERPNSLYCPRCHRPFETNFGNTNEQKSINLKCIYCKNVINLRRGTLGTNCVFNK